MRKRDQKTIWGNLKCDAPFLVSQTENGYINHPSSPLSKNINIQTPPKRLYQSQTSQTVSYLLSPPLFHYVFRESISCFFRPQGYEHYTPQTCPRCSLPVAYTATTNTNNDTYVYILPDALTAKDTESTGEGNVIKRESLLQQTAEQLIRESKERAAAVGGIF